MVVGEILGGSIEKLGHAGLSVFRFLLTLFSIWDTSRRSTLFPLIGVAFMKYPFQLYAYNENLRYGFEEQVFDAFSRLLLNIRQDVCL